MVVKYGASFNLTDCYQ